jgi:hypothetical protein
MTDVYAVVLVYGGVSEPPELFASLELAQCETGLSGPWVPDPDQKGGGHAYGVRG